MNYSLSVSNYNCGTAGQGWLRYIEAWNRHHVQDVLDCVSDNFVYDECPMTMEQPLSGKDAFEAYLKNVFKTVPDIHIELLTLEEGKGTCWSESIMRGRFVKHFLILPPFRAKVAARVACAFTVCDGVLNEERLYWDKANTLRQFGTLASLFGVITKPVWRPASNYSINPSSVPATGVTETIHNPFFNQ